ncbi:MAG: NAD(P)-dependent glycerol-3-phosphate dehydrogenase [Cyclobacteriaceae bacterium]|nr:NAD(P)-dependent glycerol-3-phosphate dehydrogenase [Cyclobacteriaceae bacterium]
MTSKNTYDKPVGVVGAGSFGTVVANLLARNTQVVLYARKPEIIEQIARTRISQGQKLHDRVDITNDLHYLSSVCDVIFPIVPSASFRKMIRDLSPWLKPHHFLIHGTKGLIVSEDKWNEGKPDKSLMPEDVFTMSRVIRKETLVVRVGCLAGPNLSKELADGQPAATVVASRFDEVIREGQRLLRNELFQVYGSKDMTGIELAGVLKNIIAVAAGILVGLGFGENAHGLLVSRGLVEMVYLGRLLGGETSAFLGLAGVGDLVATCSTNLSRNFSLGYRLAKGEKLPDILASVDEVAEGVNTIIIMKTLAENMGMRAPITESLYRVMHEEMTPEEALRLLMKSPFRIDFDIF